MNCFYHPDIEAIGTCKACSKGLCEACAVDLGQGLACKDDHEDLVADYNKLIEKNIKVFSGQGSNTLLAPAFLLVFGLILMWGGIESNKGMTSFGFLLGLASAVFSYFVYRRNKEVFGSEAFASQRAEGPGLIYQSNDNGEQSRLDNKISALGLLQNLKSGFLLLFFIPINKSEFRPGMPYVIAGLLLGIGIAIGFDYIQATGDIFFNNRGLAILGTIYLVIILLALIASAINAGIGQLAVLLTAVFSALPWYFLLVYLFRDYSGRLADVSLLWFLVYGWGLIALLRAIKLTFPKASSRSQIVPIIIALAFFAYSWNTFFYPVMLYSFDEDEYDLYDSIDQETTFYRQPALVKSKLNALKGETPGQTDMYFLGFAGDGSQDVFRSEVQFVKAVMDRQFNTQGRSLNLLNSISELSTEPFANRHNLSVALKGIADMMDLEDDILFLYLTSHGAREASLRVALHPFQLNALGVDDLSNALDEAGIGWRIIVISACYSGSFIHALANDKTLILTSAASDKNSFGCSNDRELTYFGEALFSDELTKGSDLINAFHAAKRSITDREINEGLGSSDPQIVLGSLMEEKLQASWPRLKSELAPD